MLSYVGEWSVYFVDGVYIASILSSTHFLMYELGLPLGTKYVMTMGMPFEVLLSDVLIDVMKRRGRCGMPYELVWLKK
jgi:hypothetical protein